MFFAPVPDSPAPAPVAVEDGAASKGASSCGGLPLSSGAQTREVILESEDFVRFRTQTAFLPRVVVGGRRARDKSSLSEM